MGNVIALDINLKSCIKFADRFISEEKYLDAIINLNDAIKFAKTSDEKRDIYIRYLYLLTQTDNFGSAYTVLTKLIYTYCDSDSYIFDGIDMILKESLLFSNGENLFSFEGLDIKAREDFIKIREFCKNEDYDTLIESLPILANPKNPYFQEMMKLTYEATQQNKFKVKKDKILKSAMLLYPNAPDNPYVISMLLETNDKEIIDVLEKGYRLQLEKAADNYFDLLRIGRAYMLNGRYSVAIKFFRRIKQQNRYDEETLWMLALTYYLNGESEKGRRELNTYAAFFKCSDAPISIYRAYMEGKDKAPTRYPFISDEFINKEIKRVKEFFEMFSPSEISISALEDLFKVAGHKYEALYELVREHKGPVMQKAIKNLLSSMRVNSYHKLFLFNELVQSDYEGGVDIIYKDRIFCGNVLKLRAKDIDKRYFRFYKEIVAMIPFCEEFIPLKCARLAATVKKVAEVFPLDDTEKKEATAKYIIFFLYVKALKIKIDEEYFKHIFNAKDQKLIKQMLQYFPPFK
ncbi:MAG: tetratricopeptide repeat protein [Bacillota bacterium]